MRAELHRTLRTECSAGTVAPDVAPLTLRAADQAAAERVRGAIGWMPASWVRAVNTTPADMAGDGQRSGGTYYQAGGADTSRTFDGGRTVTQRAGRALLEINADYGNALHEYTHHLQAARRDLDALFQGLHAVRGAGESVITLPSYPRTTGRKDQYIGGYFGCEYPWAGPPAYAGPTLEVLTRAMQTVAHPLYGKDRLSELFRDDPEMLYLRIV